MHKTIRATRQQRKMPALGLPDFETIEDCARRQDAMIRSLQRHNMPQGLVEGLSDCTADRCGLMRCRAGCHFSARRLRLRLVPKIARIIRGRPGPTFAVTAVHPAWSWPHAEKFDPQRVEDALGWLKRRINDIQVRPLLTFGTWEFCLNVASDGKKTWVGHVHFIINGAEKALLEKVLHVPSTRNLFPYEKPLFIQTIGTLGRQIAYTLKRYPEQRVSYIDSQGRKNQRHLPLSGADLFYFDNAMLQIDDSIRIIILDIFELLSL